MDDHKYVCFYVKKKSEKSNKAEELNHSRKHICNVCGKHFLKRYHMLRHQANVHGIQQSPTVETTGTLLKKRKHQCELCKKNFLRPSHVLRHNKSVHGIDPPQSENVVKHNGLKKQLKCEMCSAGFSAKSSLNKHLKTIHSILVESVQRGKLRCSECSSSFPTAKTFTKHLLQQHPDLTLTTEKLTFTTEDEFLSWKVQIEKDTASMYVKGNRYVSQTKSVQYYWCHRSGHYRPKGKGKRRLKLSGTNKIGFFCPARLRVQTCQTDAGTICLEVTWMSTHVGHMCESSRVRLSKFEKSTDIEMQPDVHIEAIESSALGGEVEILSYSTPLEGVNLEIYAADEPEKINSDLKDLSVLKQEARLAVIGFLPEVEKCTSSEQYQLIIEKITDLKHQLALTNPELNIPVLTIHSSTFNSFEQ